MKTLNQLTLSVIFGISIFFFSCEKIDIVRVMDTKTDTVEINSSAVVATGTVLDIGESKIIEHGHCWSINPDPTIDDYKTELGLVDERETFSSQLDRIIPGVVHYIRSYIYDGVEYVYGNTLTFTVSADDIGFLSVPASKIDETTVEISTEVNNIGSINFDNYGHCWSQTDPPTIENNITAYGNLDTNKNFISVLNNLNMGRYFIRGYLESDGGVVYSNTVVFESTVKVGTGDVTIVSETEVQANGTIRSLGVVPIIDYGHCWSAVTSSPTVNNNTNTLGGTSSLGVYSTRIDNLLTGVRYYIRAYATDGIHVFYGDVTSFLPGE